MDLATLLSERDWDQPFFKKLAKNDTAEGSGNQAGPVLPKDLRRYFPELPAINATQTEPTVDRKLRVEMYVGTVFGAVREVRYQLQTWGGTRSGESRLTEMQPLHSQSREDDILIFQRRADVLDYFRIFLVSQRNREYSQFRAQIGTRRWGPLDSINEPVSQEEIQEKQREIIDLANRVFVVDPTNVRRTEMSRERIARSAVFRERVRESYEFTCAVSGIAITTPSGLHEVEAAHVVPLSDGGMDDIRNGLSLCQTLHWAFDRGLFGITPERRVFIPNPVKDADPDGFLIKFEGKLIRENRTAIFKVHPDAFRWHLEEKVKRWFA
jgi:putative restriction endonuclease